MLINFIYSYHNSSKEETFLNIKKNMKHFQLNIYMNAVKILRKSNIYFVLDIDTCTST